MILRKLEGEAFQLQGLCLVIKNTNLMPLMDVQVCKHSLSLFPLFPFHLDR
ncbi:hypothetical protein Scep_023823 [Stephania cephalantha]|uniref:Uncharacterized protein n=1 Tax=Stephania cephalantha TaxID=152367 RepID=A0AAP0HT51_9MAGN